MKDRFFYPLFALVLVGIVLLALWPGLSNTKARPKEIVTDTNGELNRP